MNPTVDIAVVGATGVVGEAMLEILAERNFPVGKLYPLASERSQDKHVHFMGESYPVTDLKNFDFEQVQLALFSAGGAVSAEYAPKAAQAGCVVIDNTSHFRQMPGVPLVVPEVNAHAIAEFKEHNIIANPNCSTIQMVVALKPIYDAAGIERINVATYQSVSGAGRGAMTELAEQSTQLLAGKEATARVFAKQIAFNLLPHIGNVQDNGYTEEEMKMIWETRKILGDDRILINPTTVRVPVFYGHSLAVHLETEHPIHCEEVEALLRQASGVILVGDDKEQFDYATPVTHSMIDDAVFVSRVRQDISHPRGLNLWIVADNIRKGAALNSVQIAEILIRDYW